MEGKAGEMLGWTDLDSNESSCLRRMEYYSVSNYKSMRTRQSERDGTCEAMDTGRLRTIERQLERRPGRAYDQTLLVGSPISTGLSRATSRRTLLFSAEELEKESTCCAEPRRRSDEAMMRGEGARDTGCTVVDEQGRVTPAAASKPCTSCPSDEPMEVDFARRAACSWPFPAHGPRCRS